MGNPSGELNRSRILLGLLGSLTIIIQFKKLDKSTMKLAVGFCIIDNILMFRMKPAELNPFIDDSESNGSGRNM